ncbi:MAG: TrmH family RNA methyltransferase [Actinomycetota bacterium]
MITSSKNRHVSQAAKLKKRALRERERRFLVEGVRATREALAAGALEELFVVSNDDAELEELAGRAEEKGILVLRVSERVASHLTSAVTPQGIVGVAGFVDVELSEVPRPVGLAPVLCSVRDPGNAGTILRSAEAAGADAVFFSESSVDVYNAKTVRASAGSLFHVPVVRRVTVAEIVETLRADGVQILAATASGEASVYDVDLAPPTAFLLGNEAWGLPPDLIGLADGTVRVPIRGSAESLNLAAAGALLLFEASRQRAGGGHGDGGSLAEQLAAATHDLRSPLAGLTGFSGTLVTRWNDLDDTTRQELIGAMTLEAERAAALVRLLVDAAKLESGRLEASVENLELQEIAERTAKVMGHSPDAPPVEIAGVARALADPDRLRSVLAILIDGAARWGERGAVHVSFVAGTGESRISIERDGCVLTPEEAAVLLEGPARGGRIEPYLARLAVEAQGGHLSFESGGLVRFTLSLPSAKLIR